MLADEYFPDLRSFHSEEISFLLSSVCIPKVEDLLLDSDAKDLPLV